MPPFTLDATDVLIYHGNCNDGFACRYIVHELAKVGASNDCVYIPAQPSNEISQNILDACKDKNILIADLSFSRDVLLQIKEVAKDLVVVDHHKTAKEFLQGLDFAYFDQDKCGATLLWHVFYPDRPMPSIIKYVEDRDLWRHKLDWSAEVNAYIDHIGHDTSRWHSAYLDIEYNFNEVVKYGDILLRQRNKMVDAAVQCARSVDLCMSPSSTETVPARAVCCSTRELISDTGHKILEQYPDCVVACMFYVDVDGAIGCSLRSRPNYDCSVIAKAFGGGGHAQSCGFRSHMHLGFPWALVEQIQD